MKYQELREEVTRISRRMGDSGLVRTTAGNVSARTPDGDVLITPSGLPYEDLEAGDLALVDLDGNLLEGPLEPSTEVPMHTGIYRQRPGVGGIVHTHAPYSTALACLGLEIPAVHYMLAALSEEGRVPLAPYATYGTEELAGYASETLGGTHSACLLQNHGTITVAETATKAYSLTEILEEMAELYYRTRLAGDPIILGPDRIAETRAKIAGYGQAKRS
ncbi:fuculose phosphate aldolase [Rubrobacter tropicus]|uniref:Fuculose phosphate aldolase n=1 Tax=Rubrobacter tropicus TaxID=2653851 RepID=A0A6G8Q4W6_9ACTN|nr:class II aldolase/adducin family protein [Rubrobacter tropicus]QIN81506.1 fuculose phosphate aldolase [Rubrobacter tropicus]